MMKLVPALALALGVVFAAPAFAAEAPKTKAECEKVKDMKWDEAAKKCITKK